MSEPTAREVAYLLVAYPRTSELFVTSEIHRVERAGIRLRLYVLKEAEPGDRHPRHPVVDRVVAEPEYLSPVTSIRDDGLLRWTAHNIRPFLPRLLRVAVARPLGLGRALGLACVQAARAARAGARGSAVACFKELLLAVDLADRLRHAPAVRHLHAHFAHRATTVAWLAATIMNLPFSFTGHAKDIYQESLNPAGLLRRKLAAARFAVTCTDANRQHLLAIAPGAPIHRVYHGLNADLARLLEHPAAGGREEGALRIVSVGRLVRKKGFDVLVDALALLRARGHDVQLVLAGADGDHGTEIRARIARHGLSGRVRLPGLLAQPELYEAYRRASVFCLPCRVLDNGDRDGIPNVLVEAMAAGLPVVTTAVSGIPELVTDGENGLIVRPDDPAALADALARLHADPMLARRLAEAGRATVRERFDGDRLADQLAALFAEAVA
jgi:glycosyltransferase involved in cell wall biosynthesis